MANDRWQPEREYDRRRHLERRDWRERTDPDYEGQGYDPYADPLYREGGYYDRRPYFGSSYHSANFGIPGAMGPGGDYYTGGGFFGSQGRQGTDPGYRGDGDYPGRNPKQHHRGRGPRGYERSDERINEDVHDRLTEDWVLDASEITVSVSGGEVTLDGTVDSRQDKRRAEDIVDGISGVGHVQNNLRVKPRYSDDRSMTGA